MNQPELATCQCIIAHPSKPKFLAVKHTGGHLPPTVKIPLEFDVGRNWLLTRLNKPFNPVEPNIEVLPRAALRLEILAV